MQIKRIGKTVLDTIGRKVSFVKHIWVGNLSGVFHERINFINGIKYSLLILSFAFSVFVIGNGVNKLAEGCLFLAGKISAYEACGMEKIGGYVFEENGKLTGGIYPVCLSPHLRQERLKLTLSVFDCGRPFSVALPSVEQPAGEKADSSGNKTAKNGENHLPSSVIHFILAAYCAVFLLCVFLGYQFANSISDAPLKMRNIPRLFLKQVARQIRRKQ
jgi:hypothetical protein